MEDIIYTKKKRPLYKELKDHNIIRLFSEYVYIYTSSKGKVEMSSTHNPITMKYIYELSYNKRTELFNSRPKAIKRIQELLG